jgi:hypothetical protein
MWVVDMSNGDPEESSELVEDSDVYEELVAGIEASEGAERVETKYDLPLNHGGSKEIDVAVWTNADHHDIFLIIECKLWNSSVEQAVIAETISNVSNSSADKGVVVAKSGFQSGAIEQAQGTGVELYTLRELTDEDLEDRLQRIETEIEIQYPRLALGQVEVSPLEDNSSGQSLSQIQGKSRDDAKIFASDRRATGYTIKEVIEEVSQDLDPGGYTIRFSDKLLLIDEQFYKLESVNFAIRSDEEQTSEISFSLDAKEMYDLVRINEIVDQSEDTDEDALEFFALDEALTAFTEHNNQPDTS